MGNVLTLIVKEHVVSLIQSAFFFMKILMLKKHVYLLQTAKEKLSK